MSYQESDGTVTLTMSMADYQSLVLALGCAAGCASRDGVSITDWLALANRLNEGNPRWTPYQVGEAGIEPENPQASTENHT